MVVTASLNCVIAVLALAHTGGSCPTAVVPTPLLLPQENESLVRASSLKGLILYCILALITARTQPSLPRLSKKAGFLLCLQCTTTIDYYRSLLIG